MVVVIIIIIIITIGLERSWDRDRKSLSLVIPDDRKKVAAPR